MAKFNNKFEFIGAFGVNKENDKVVTVTPRGDKGWKEIKFNLAVRESKTNSMFVTIKELHHETNRKLNVFTKKMERLEVPFADRSKVPTMEVSDLSKFIIDLETDFEKKEEYEKLTYKINNLSKKEDITVEEKERLNTYKKEFKEKAINRHEFITVYDAIEFLKENIDILRDKKVKITGNVIMSEWKGKCYTSYIVNKIEYVHADTPNALGAKLDIFFNKDCMDESVFKENKKIFIEGYLLNRDDNAKADRYFKRTFIINAANLNLEDEFEKELFEFLKEKFEIKGKGYYHLLWEANIYKGAEEVEFTEEMLTKKQRQAIALGMGTLEGYRPKNKTLGNSIDEIRVFKPLLTGDFADGAIDTEMKESEFEELIAMSTEDVKIDEVKEEKKVEDQPKEEVEKNSMDDKLKALFG